ncbi:hypothetical protein GQ42DRAFT_42520 [Ramicandelaber brevisporus]|nr:hypothetical protein GQ42DRAFT_42520 [Ramicandelaber brevisporus]
MALLVHEFVSDSAAKKWLRRTLTTVVQKRECLCNPLCSDCKCGCTSTFKKKNEREEMVESVEVVRASVCLRASVSVFFLCVCLAISCSRSMQCAHSSNGIKSRHQPHLHPSTFLHQSLLHTNYKLSLPKKSSILSTLDLIFSCYHHHSHTPANCDQSLFNSS